MAVAAVTERLKQLTEREREIKTNIYLLQDGSTIADIELPGGEKILEDFPLVARKAITFIERRRVPVLSRWQADRDSITIRDLPIAR